MYPIHSKLYSIEDVEELRGLFKNGCDREDVYVYSEIPPPRTISWSKSRGQPDTGRQGLATSREPSFTMSHDDDDMRSGSTPYRLPRLSPRGDQSPEMDQSNPEDGKNPKDDKVWSRYGFEKIIRVPELGPQIRVLLPPPKSYLQHHYQHSAAPRFKHAAITPTVRSLPWTMGRETEEQRLQLFNNTSASRVHPDDMSSRSTRLEPTPTPISRSESPAKSVKSIHWVLGHNRYHTFDKKGRSHVQGPYSREFNVTCVPPANWLRMKLGRSKTMIPQSTR